MDLRVPPREPGSGAPPQTMRVPLTHVKIFGWYDNEMGSYTYRLGELTTNVARHM
jgi:glyceraldehyde 3-phosphate dehydrogenase